MNNEKLCKKFALLVRALGRFMRLAKRVRRRVALRVFFILNTYADNYVICAKARSTKTEETASRVQSTAVHVYETTIGEEVSSSLDQHSPAKGKKILFTVCRS